MIAPRQQPIQRFFDGVICFGGGDWWYHNRGHYDVKMMCAMSKLVPVLWVNSLGVRFPKASEGSFFFHRVARKLDSVKRGMVRVDENFGVFSPVFVPGRLTSALSGWLLGPQVRRVSRRLGIRRPLVWVTCPTGVLALRQIGPVGLVYQRTDRWESYPGGDSSVLLGYHDLLSGGADLTLYCSTALFEAEAERQSRGLLVDHGVDFERYAAAGRGALPEPQCITDIPRPRIGFIGGIDASTFDSDLFREVARELPDANFLLVGTCSLRADWIDLPNVHLLGQVAYEDVPAYMAACDVLIMPWNESEWVRACNPVKLKEYLAVGRPIVSTPFPELRNYGGVVRQGKGPVEFASQIRDALANPEDQELLRSRVRDETWHLKFRSVMNALKAQGIQPEIGSSDCLSIRSATV